MHKGAKAIRRLDNGDRGRRARSRERPFQGECRPRIRLASGCALVHAPSNCLRDDFVDRLLNRLVKIVRRDLAHDLVVGADEPGAKNIKKQLLLPSPVRHPWS